MSAISAGKPSPEPRESKRTGHDEQAARATYSLCEEAVLMEAMAFQLHQQRTLTPHPRRKRKGEMPTMNTGTRIRIPTSACAPRRPGQTCVGQQNTQFQRSKHRVAREPTAKTARTRTTVRDRCASCGPTPIARAQRDDVSARLRERRRKVGCSGHKAGASLH